MIDFSSTRSQEITTNLSKVQERIINAAQIAGRKPEEVTLVAVTKNFPVSDIKILSHLGIQNMGENKDQEAYDKAQQMKESNIRWHFVGQIQSKKISRICSYASTIHSVDRIKVIHACERNTQSPVNIFLQVNLEPFRHDRGGVAAEDLEILAEAVMATENLHLQGLMCVLPEGKNVEEGFIELQKIHETFVCHFPHATDLSAGMSHDYEEAIKFGATHLRIGSDILGKRVTSR